MPGTLIDISRILRDGLPVWPGDPPVRITPLRAIGGVNATISELCLSTHAGTHVDAPSHLYPGLPTVDRLELDALIGPAWLIHLEGSIHITAQTLAGAGVPAGAVRLLIRTSKAGGGHDADATGFDPAFIALLPDAAQWLLQREIVLVGIDAPSIEPFDAQDLPVHRALLSAGVVIVEGLDLAGAPPGAYQLICLPLPVAGGDGAPARVLLAPADWPVAPRPIPRAS